MTESFLQTEQSEIGQLIEEIKSGVQGLLPKYAHLSFIVDLEGVLLPYGISRPDLLHDPLASYAVKKLPVNRALLSLLRTIVALDREKITVASGSQLDLYLRKSSLDVLPPAVSQALYRGHDLLHEQARDSFVDMGMPLPQDSLVVVLNDNVTPAGDPPDTILTYFQQTQPYARSASILSIPIPQFDGVITSDYNKKMYENISSTLEMLPRQLV